MRHSEPLQNKIALKIWLSLAQYCLVSPAQSSSVSLAHIIAEFYKLYSMYYMQWNKFLKPSSITFYWKLVKIFFIPISAQIQMFLGLILQHLSTAALGYFRAYFVSIKPVKTILYSSIPVYTLSQDLFLHLSMV